ncbi:hypothetical protein LCGC14_2002150 [marine sediment metagenome]|uniref:Uncharacterized protein n=1 Tax=marine sediment metagenome TaxID=412755 RepID=A0A0F9F338_9ZZZZ
MSRLEAIKESIKGTVTPEMHWTRDLLSEGLGFRRLLLHERGDQEFVLAAPGNMKWLVERLEELARACRAALEAQGDTNGGPCEVKATDMRAALAKLEE